MRVRFPPPALKFSYLRDPATARSRRWGRIWWDFAGVRVLVRGRASALVHRDGKPIKDFYTAWVLDDVVRDYERGGGSRSSRTLYSTQWVIYTQRVDSTSRFC